MSHFDDVAAFPLCWPEGWPRTKAKKIAHFKQTTFTATENLMEQLRMMGAKDVILSTSIPLRRDGLPLAKPPVDGDHGAAVYFLRKGKPLCLACDQYYHVEDNIQALAKTIEALRGLERWGSSDLLDRAFTGFAALPAPAHGTDWRSVLGATTLEEAEAKYRELAKIHHPDKGGTDEAMAALNAAIEAARSEPK